jgi:hypothetical protein
VSIWGRHKSANLEPGGNRSIVRPCHHAAEPSRAIMSSCRRAIVPESIFSFPLVLFVGLPNLVDTPAPLNRDPSALL